MSSFFGAHDLRETPPEGVDDLGGVVHRQGGLGHEGEEFRALDLQCPHIVHGLDQIDATGAVAAPVLPERALDLRMPGVTDEDALPALVLVMTDLHVDLGDQRADGVEDLEAPPCAFLAHRLGDPVGAEDHGAVVGNIVKLVNEHGTLGAQAIDDILVVDDLVADIDRRPIEIECALDDPDGAIDSGAKTAWVGKHDLHNGNPL